MSALHQWSKRRSEDERDEMRTGGGLSFNEEWSSPQGLRQHSQNCSVDDAFRNRNPTAGRSQRTFVTERGSLLRIKLELKQRATLVEINLVVVNGKFSEDKKSSARRQ